MAGRYISGGGSGARDAYLHFCFCSLDLRCKFLICIAFCCKQIHVGLDFCICVSISNLFKDTAVKKIQRKLFFALSCKVRLSSKK